MYLVEYISGYQHIHYHASVTLQPTQAAVMVWIHGGSIEIGTSMTWDFYGLPLVAVGDVILVTLNYRLGIFSQFTTRKCHGVTSCL